MMQSTEANLVMDNTDETDPYAFKLYHMNGDCFSKIMQYVNLREVMTCASVNKYSRDLIYDSTFYHKCITPFDLTIVVQKQCVHSVILCVCLSLSLCLVCTYCILCVCVLRIIYKGDMLRDSYLFFGPEKDGTYTLYLSLDDQLRPDKKLLLVARRVRNLKVKFADRLINLMTAPIHLFEFSRHCSSITLNCVCNLHFTYHFF